MNRPPRPPMVRDVREQLGDIHFQAAEIQRMVTTCFTSGYVGKEWLLRMQHSYDRIGQLLEKVNS